MTEKGERFTMEESIVASSATCVIIKELRTRERDGASADLEYSLTLDTKPNKGKTYLGISVKQFYSTFEGTILSPLLTICIDVVL